MKNATLNETRIKSVIESDRFSATAQSLELIEKDLYKVLSDYFSITEKPSLKLCADEKGYKITVEAACNAIKSTYHL
ncbi:MAG: cell division topological specificity factor MinE [Clostridia bacterium]|nr:cell division topological specificity factor MinE [Clostridia bacterium]